MTKTEHSSEETLLTEEQRLALLERSVSLNKIVLLAVGLIIIVALSVTITIAVVRGMSGDAQLLSAPHFREMQQQLVKLDATVAQQKQEIQQLKTQVQALNQSPVGSGAAMMRETLIGQEKSFALFVRSMKNGMHDLANMVPGSRTWLDLYSDALDKVIAQGQKRIKTLQNWADTSAAPKPQDKAATPDAGQGDTGTPDNQQ
ncbi:hypothetical protein [Mangrovitalea sediminis]|uniref:hypothetical protein n=1 Tax=Mangrovitalea sediminis TaxID=1982043 RepID=UPI000BE5B6DD|nr:hypothetical protein [Mangrovitalea sediminis]